MPRHKWIEINDAKAQREVLKRFTKGRKNNLKLTSRPSRG